MPAEPAKLKREAKRLATAFGVAATAHPGAEAGFQDEAESALEQAATALGVENLHKRLEP